MLPARFPISSNGPSSSPKWSFGSGEDCFWLILVFFSPAAPRVETPPAALLLGLPKGGRGVVAPRAPRRRLGALSTAALRLRPRGLRPRPSPGLSEPDRSACSRGEAPPQHGVGARSCRGGARHRRGPLAGPPPGPPALRPGKKCHACCHRSGPWTVDSDRGFCEGGGPVLTSREPLRR